MKLVIAIAVLFFASTANAQNTWCDVKGIKYLKSVEMMLTDGDTYSDGTCRSGTLPRDSDFPIKGKDSKPLDRSNASNVWCEKGERVSFHSNGMLRRCTLARTMVLQNELCRDRASASFSSDGTLQSC